MKKSGASRAQPQTGQVRLPRVTGNTPAPTAVNNNDVSLASVSITFMGVQGHGRHTTTMVVQLLCLVSLRSI